MHINTDGIRSFLKTQDFDALFAATEPVAAFEGFSEVSAAICPHLEPHDRIGFRRTTDPVPGFEVRAIVAFRYTEIDWGKSPTPAIAAVFPENPLNADIKFPGNVADWIINAGIDELKAEARDSADMTGFLWALPILAACLIYGYFSTQDYPGGTMLSQFVGSFLAAGIAWACIARYKTHKLYKNIASPRAI
jgi:hypothetical protein